MRYVILAVVALVLLQVADSYKCNNGKCAQGDQCCNHRSYFSRCCHSSAQCCYHGPWTRCCGPLDTCCWGVHYRGIACCPRQFHCCGMGYRRRRSGCCWKTPLWLWVIVGFCISIIMLLLLLSLYQCFLEQREEYENQRLNGTIPPEQSWYYYDYGTGNRYRPTPPAYTPPPNYTAPTPPTNSRNFSNNPSRNNNPNNNNNGVPKPPTPAPGSQRSGSIPVEESLQNRAALTSPERYESAVSHRSEEVSALSHRSELNNSNDTINESELSEPELAASLAARDPILNVMHTLYTHPVPRLQRMLCTKHNCMVDDGSCVFCMDAAEKLSSSFSDNEDNDDRRGRRREGSGGVFFDDLNETKGDIVVGNPLNEQRIKSD